uniref:HL03793p n=1 Tax=Drosophila melanogaster TaxID=7227 RepID=Q95S05_DROME|nr:HL03793p [Drosophila melanogaster]
MAQLSFVSFRPSSGSLSVERESIHAARPAFVTNSFIHSFGRQSVSQLMEFGVSVLLLFRIYLLLDCIASGYWQCNWENCKGPPRNHKIP